MIRSVNLAGVYPCTCGHKKQDHSILDIGGPCLCCDCSEFVVAARDHFLRDVLLLIAAAVAWIAFLIICGLSSGCGTVETPPCTDQLAPGDTGELSWPCPSASGYSYGCAGSPSQKPMVDCEIDDGRVGHFRTVCVDACPGAR